ncbi:MAG: hypothetical protein M3041_19005 [Acidobacteriota bacterium]|nr:hypothetical protein [Acidobacteriota bacterium]
MLSVAYAFSGGAVVTPVNMGSKVMFRIEVRDAGGANISSEDIPVVVYGFRLRSATQWTRVGKDDDEESEGDAAFEFEEDNARSYKFTLKTRNLAKGDYVLGFTIGGDPTIHTTPFSLQ